MQQMLPERVIFDGSGSKAACPIAALRAREQMIVAAPKNAGILPIRDDQQIVEFTQTFRPKPEK